MTDLISRQALCEYALNQKDKSITPNEIMRFPSAYPKKGKWIKDREKRRYGYYGHYVYYEETTWTCSECGYRRFITSCPDDKFCKECGADMRGEE